MRHTKGWTRALLPSLAVVTVAAGAAVSPAAVALNTVPTDVGPGWQVHDAAIPGVDTGSVQDSGSATSTYSSPSSALQGYGGLRVEVNGGRSALNGILLRGFGITYDGRQTFSTTRGVSVDGLVVQRELTVDGAKSYGRFFDSFTNTTKSPVTVTVAFGGQLGHGTGAKHSELAATSDGDRSITPADRWAEWYTPSNGAGSASTSGPSATIFGTPDRPEALLRMGNFLRDPFANKLATTGDESNHPGFVSRLVIEPGDTQSLARYVVTGLSEVSALPDRTVPAPGSEVQSVQTVAATLAARPDLAGLSPSEVCSIANFAPRTLGVTEADCAQLPTQPIVNPVRGGTPAGTARTTSSYNVVGKSIAKLTADMKSGRTTSRQITRAYLDRIAAYDQGPFGLHSVITVAPDAMKQAKAADKARKKGDKRQLLGIPILLKDIIDTKDMPTTGGSLLFDGYTPKTDAWQVKKLRQSGAIMLGKANLSKFANSGFFGDSDYGQVWNAFDPSRSSIGSSGGSAVALASSFAAAAMGTQTGDSLWGPAGAASLYSLRGTDGMQSSAGVMPLAQIQDYVGFMAQTPKDLASLLNVAAVDNPADDLDDVANGHRPKNWKKSLKAKALRGKVVGIPAGAFDDPLGTTETSRALKAQFSFFKEAGATIKQIPAAPAAPPAGSFGSVYTEGNYQGWKEWLEAHPDSPVGLSQLTTATSGWTEAQQREVEAWRAEYRRSLATWMDDNGVDTVLYPTELSDIHLNDSLGATFGRRDPQSSDAGVPTMIFPAGVNSHDQPIGFQLQGKAFQDAKLLGYAYAFEKIADGRVLPSTTPALKFDADAVPSRIKQPRLERGDARPSVDSDAAAPKG